ncbi:MAG: amidohydrolase family protein [Eggerthellaceae bacterium]|nr:amidohydrolase family protein [Eggerthellaceae bacterium]
MKADKIIKNAKIYTADKEHPFATALAVKDGACAYVGDEVGLADFEGEVVDLGGKFVMPGIIDSHVHVTTGVGFEYAELGLRIEPDGKQDALDFMENYIKEHPGQKRYRFLMERKFLRGEDIYMDELDKICPDAELVLLEGEIHSNWANSKVYELHGITDETPDPVPGLAYYVRKDGHLTGNSFESASWVFVFDSLENITDEQIDTAVDRWIDYCKSDGVSAVFDAGWPMHNHIHEKIYARLREYDRQGRLPIYIDGCYVLSIPAKKDEALAELERFHREFGTEHLKVHTLKIFMDGTMKIETAAQVMPYADTGEKGYTAFEAPELAEIIVALNEMGFDLHTHCVGERASRVVLDAVELARKQLGDDFHVKVTCAHLEIQDDADLPRFAELGVIANFTPWWHSSDPALNVPILGERAYKQLRCKTLWDTGALVTWSSDNVAYGDFMTWSPYLGMEIGMTRWANEKTRVPDYNKMAAEYPPAEEKMNIEEMLLGYTINGAIQLGVEDAKGSIEAGKDADFLVFDNDLLAAEPHGFSYNKPTEVYFGGVKVN